MSDSNDVRERIISSVFDRRSATGQQETYVGHLKIWEDAEDGVKPRYIIISHSNNVSGFIHKSKLNANGSFSVGKTWNLADVRGVQVYNFLHLNITLTRTYKWRTDNGPELRQFVNVLVTTFKTITHNAPLRLIGVEEPETQPSRLAGQGHIDPRPAGRTPVSARFNGEDRTVRSTSRNRSSSTPRSSTPVAPTQNPVLSPSQFQSARQSSPARSATPASSSGSQFAARSITPSREDVASRASQGTPVSIGRSHNLSNSSRSVTPEVPLYSRNQPFSTFLTERSSVASTTSSSLASKQSKNLYVSSSTPPPSGDGILVPSPRPLTSQGSESTSSSRPSLAASQTPSASKTAVSPLGPLLQASTQPKSASGSNVNSSTPLRGRPSSPAVQPPSARLAAHSPALNSSLVPSAQNPIVLSPAPLSALVSPSQPSALLSAVPHNALLSAVSENPLTPWSGQIPPLPPGDPSGQSRNARISFFDAANQMALDRLVAGDYIDTSGVDGEDESVQATLATVSEMLEGYEWATDDILGRKGTTGAAEQIEARLLDELLALDKASVHSFIESDDRVGIVIKYLEDAIAELDTIDSYVSSYKIHLNDVAEDISYIQSQNRGLQVQTQNQRALVTELEQLLQTVHVDREVLVILTQESLEKSKSIRKLEEAAAELYKALQTGRDRDIAATMERLGEYKTYNAQFCKRILDYLSIMFTAQSKMLLGGNDGVEKASGKKRASIISHKNFERYIGRYSGLVLYLKEMDENSYGKLCAAYFSTSSELHSTQMKALLQLYSDATKRTPEDDAEHSFAGPNTALVPRTTTGMRRAGTIVRSPLANKEKQPDGDLRAQEALFYILEALAPQIHQEQLFIADFLQINDAALTFADYMGLENYFRRQAAGSASLSQTTSKLVRGAMDLIFGFLPAALKTWIDIAVSSDNLGATGILASIERFMSRVDERANAYLFAVLEKQQARLKGIFDRHVSEQIKTVEATKVTSKKRTGVVPFIKYFPIYVGRVESLMVGTDSLDIRQSVDAAYEKIVNSMFDCLKHMAKLDGEEEDKEQLNYHVILIENMHHFAAEISKIEIGSVTSFLERAESIYDENLNAYVRFVLRRPFMKILDYFEGVERLLKTTAPTEVANHASYNKSSLKKVVKEYNAKDIRKHVDALFKRVEKHFTEASDTTTQQESGPIAQGTVMVGVWKACEEEVVRITELFQKRISQCYANSIVSLEYSVADVEGAFRRHKIGS